MANILIADDDNALLFAISRGLAKAGHYPTKVTTASDAIKLIKSVQYDCIITDIHLPGSGYSIIRSAVKYLKTTPIIVITGSRFIDDKEKSLKLGAAKVVEKPISLNHLTKLVNYSLAI